MNNPSVRRHSDLLKILRPAKEAAAQTAAVPEKDPNDKGTAPAPALPADKKDQSGVPDGTVNVDKTPANPVVAPAATVNGTEKVATLTARAGAVVSGIQALLKQSASDPKAADPAGPKMIKNEPTPAPNAEGKAADAAAPKDPKEKPAETPKTDAKPAEVPEVAKAADAKAAADVVVPEFTPDFHLKIAQTVLQFEDGRNMVEQCLRREFGMQQADDIIKAAMFAEEQAIALNQAELQGATAAEELIGAATDQDVKVASDLAALHDEDLTKFASDEEREAYFEGVKLAAQVADAMSEGASPDEMAAPPEGPEAGGEGEVTPEDILEVVQYLLSNGQISEEEAQQILASLQGGAEGAGAEGGDGASGGPPMDPEAMKEASVRDEAFKASQALVEAALA